MVPWIERPVVELSLDAPLETRFDAVHPQVFQAARELLAAIQKEVPAAARKLAPLVRLRTADRFQREAVALAKLAGTAWQDLIVASVSYELVLSFYGCSTIALATCDGPVLARNMDWWPEGPLARASFLFKTQRQGSLFTAVAGWPGSLGVVSGLSGRGFAVVLNAVLSPEGISWIGYPVMLQIRRVLEDAASFDEALASLSQTKLAASALLTLVGSENHQRVVIERTPTRHALRFGAAGKPLLATNDYRLLYRPQTSDSSEIYQTTCQRFTALGELLAVHHDDRSVSDEELLYLLTDARVRQTITAQHVLIRPASQGIRLFIPRRFLQTG